MSLISDKVLSMSIGYLGPAAKIFLSRQTKMHMNGLEFTAVEKNHIPELAKWVRISACLVIDKDKANELAVKISQL
jgi:hypothetical protein